MTHTNCLLNPLRLLALLPLVALGCAGGTGATGNVGPRHMLWRVQSPTTVAYLMGSVHALPSDAYPLDSILERAMDSSDVLALEIALDQVSQESIQQRMMSDAVFTDGRTLKSVLSDSTWELLVKRLDASELPAEMLNPLEPWAVSLILMAMDMAKEGMQAEQGLDMYFLGRAKELGRPVVGLETVESQMDIFDKLPYASQETLLRQTLTDMDSTNRTLKRLVDAWRVGDVRAMETLALEPMKDDTIFYRRFLADRNYAWLPQVETFLSGSRRHLVVVGAAHLIGQDGLVAQLRKRGYRVEQL